MTNHEECVSLEPCPFCGGEAAEAPHMVYCTKCFAEGPTRLDATQDFIVAWNKAANAIRELTAEVERLSRSWIAVVNEAADERTAKEAAEAEVERLRGELRRIAEGNCGDAPWQADYAKIRKVAAAALKEPQ